ncbi:MAG TPA: hypothetical protein DHV68_06740 [Dehalococcoidia bacterium]|nr:hypothetical protein [Chloroflexota bacterium]HCI86527.1 hypothetical protein [Dehalococcoidia bacterium]
MALVLNTPSHPPRWALLERELLKAQTAACERIFEKYFDERGYLLCMPRWGGNDGSDDAIENLAGWPVLHALGAPDSILEKYKLGWEGHLLQYTEAKTVEVELARDGMLYKEFPVSLDWFHHGESMSVFNLQGLSDPEDSAFLTRVRRYAGLYMDEDSQAKNYDPEHKIIRSLFNGSRGPLLRKATALDWAGDPFEVEGRFDAAHGERNFDEMLAHFEDYTDIVGDHPINLAATTLAANAYMATGDQKYKDWLLEYVDAWAERAKDNDGILPSNIGLDGTIGGECDGKWYGGCYGWGFTVVVPQTGELSDRNAVYRGIAGFGNALLMTGDRSYTDVWSKMLAAVNGNSKSENGRTLYPHMHGDNGWYGYEELPYSEGAIDTFYWSMDSADREYLPDSEWLDFLDGNLADFPVIAMENEFGSIRQKIRGVNEDTSSPDTRLSDNTLQFNTANTTCLTQLMMGALTPRFGEPLHARVRYFDPAERRAGIPEDVAALVVGMTDTTTTLSLANISPVNSIKVIIQAGAYAEHQLTYVEHAGQKVAVNDSFFNVELRPSAVATIVLHQERYANQPTLTHPWNTD